jgi:hypothetical protein
MTTDSSLPALTRWIRTTTLGWILGFPLVIVLALAGETVGIGGNQSLVGAAMGLGIGWMQGRALRTTLGAARPWIIATTLGLAFPFIIYDLSVALERQLPYQLPYVVAIGGLCVGTWQSLILGRQFRGNGLWIGASLVGWTLAASAAYFADTLRSSGLRGIVGALAYLGLAALGGPVLGMVTGIALRGLKRRSQGA